MLVSIKGIRVPWRNGGSRSRQGKMEGGSAASLTRRELLKMSLEHSGIDSLVRDLETRDRAISTIKCSLIQMTQ